MAYITNYTLGKLTQVLTHSKDDISKEEFLEHVYDDPRIYEYLNKLEIGHLFHYVQTLKEPINYLKQVPSQYDTGTFVQERDSKLIYHLYTDCELLNKDFVGFLIPPEVKENKLITEYREWFEKNDFIAKYLEKKTDESNIILKYNTSFARVHELPRLNEKYKLIVERSNSGHEHFQENFNIQKFYREISHWVYQADDRLPIKTWKTLGKWHSYGRKSISELSELLDRLEIDYEFREYNSIDEISKKLKEHDASMYRLLKLLQDYFCWTYGLTTTVFDIVTLENFNLKCCRDCSDVRNKNVAFRLRKDNAQDNDLPY